MINLELIDDFKQEEWDFNRVCMKDPDNKDVKIIVGYHGSCVVLMVFLQRQYLKCLLQLYYLKMSR